MFDDVTKERANEIIERWEGIGDIHINPVVALDILFHIERARHMKSDDDAGARSRLILHTFLNRFIEPLDEKCDTDAGEVSDDVTEDPDSFAGWNECNADLAKSGKPYPVVCRRCRGGKCETIGVKPRSGTKYDRVIHPKYPDRGEKPITVDVYDVLAAFGVTSQPRGHALKKCLAAGTRHKGGEIQDLREAIDAIERDIELVERSNPGAFD